MHIDHYCLTLPKVTHNPTRERKEPGTARVRLRRFWSGRRESAYPLARTRIRCGPLSRPLRAALANARRVRTAPHPERGSLPGPFMRGARHREGAGLRNILERATGIEPASSAWKAGVLPLNYARKYGRDDRIRTCDILLPKQARYQTAPRPEGVEQLGSSTLLVPRPDDYRA